MAVNMDELHLVRAVICEKPPGKPSSRRSTREDPSDSLPNALKDATSFAPSFAPSFAGCTGATATPGSHLAVQRADLLSRIVVAS